jgi:hypothetical protein
MDRLKLLPFVLLLAACAGLCASAQEQSVQGPSTGAAEGKPVPQSRVSMPFPVDSPAPGRALAVEFRPAGQMTEKDRQLEAAAESAISEKAGFADLEFNVGKWTYQQIVCPALPGHLFLGFARNNGAGDVSLFTASIPRAGDGKVRIIPIQRRGYSLFSPAPINALTIAAFNHIRAEEPSDPAPDWAGTALCYAALAGAHPQAEIPGDSPAGQAFPQDPRAIMDIPDRGGAIIQFTDVSSLRRPMEWTLTFNGKGRLLKATHVYAPLAAARAVPPAPVDKQGGAVQAGVKTVPPAPW